MSHRPSPSPQQDHASPAHAGAARHRSVFEQVFDFAILGAGHIGAAAARALARRGFRLLLVEPSGQLLWESTCALENDVGAAAEDGGEEWSRWLGELGAPGAMGGDGRLDRAFAELRLAREYADSAGRISTLFYAQPVGVECADGALVGVTVATKSGLRPIRARRWIDASENGLLALLCDARLRSRIRPPEKRVHSLVLQAADWAPHRAALAAHCEETGARLDRSARSTEMRLLWDADDTPWHVAMTARLRQLRRALPLPSPVIVSQLSAVPFPVYAKAARPAPASPAANLTVLSPALADKELRSLASRFAHGSESARKIADSPLPDFPPPCDRDLAPARAVSARTCAVLVAGAGTAGALAALSASRAGAETVAIDFSFSPGGVGTAAGITGYFHGLAGGLQTETDRLTVEMNLLLEGRDLASRRWHHEGKKLALLAAFEAQGVAFHGGTLLYDVEKTDSGRVTAVLAATADGPVRYLPRACIDCTGDGDLCALAGAEFSTGRPGDGRTLAYSQSAFVLKTRPAGLEISSCNFDAGWTDPTDPEDLTRARLEGLVQHLREAWTEADCPLAMAPFPGIRQSRQIATDYTLSFRDLVRHARFADSVGEAGSIADTHSVDFEFEDDEAFFFFSVCRLFRHPLRTELPYRMLLPRGLENVWIACRAAGIENTASYAVRMQRDMQRLGEAAGRAAALASARGLSSRDVAPTKPTPPSEYTLEQGRDAPPPDELLAAGLNGLHLWRLHANPQLHRERVERELRSPLPEASFYAACILAMWEDEKAEPRLLRALRRREEGPPPSPDNTGAHGQEIDLPFWLVALILLRRCGTGSCVGELQALAASPDTILNVRTALALTVERLVRRGRITAQIAASLVAPMVDQPPTDAVLAPSRSIWRTLRNEPQITLRNHTGASTGQDHAWQLHLVVARIRLEAGLPPHDAAGAFLADNRAQVRNAFQRLPVLAPAAL